VAKAKTCHSLAAVECAQGRSIFWRLASIDEVP
jgi:hypothetical protein